MDINNILSQFYISCGNINHHLESIKLILLENDKISQTLKNQVDLILNVCQSDYNSLGQCRDKIEFAAKRNSDIHGSYLDVSKRFERLSENMMKIQRAWDDRTKTLVNDSLNYFGDSVLSKSNNNSVIASIDKKDIRNIFGYQYTHHDIPILNHDTHSPDLNVHNENNDISDDVLIVVNNNEIPYNTVYHDDINNNVSDIHSIQTHSSIYFKTCRTIIIICFILIVIIGFIFACPILLTEIHHH